MHEIRTLTLAFSTSSPPIPLPTRTHGSRSATARASLLLPQNIFELLKPRDPAAPAAAAAAAADIEIAGAKGPVFSTAIVAGTMGAKRTADLIPFCHPLPVEHVDIQVRAEGAGG